MASDCPTNPTNQTVRWTNPHILNPVRRRTGRLSCVRRGQGECASSKRKQITATHSAWKLLMIIVGKHKESVDSTWSGEKGVFSRACLHLWVSWVGPWASWCQPDTNDIHDIHYMIHMISMLIYSWCQPDIHSLLGLLHVPPHLLWRRQILFEVVGLLLTWGEYLPKHLERLVCLSMNTLADTMVPNGWNVWLRSESVNSWWVKQVKKGIQASILSTTWGRW